MAFFQIPSPDLSGLTLGEATPRLMEAYGFTDDESKLLVRVTYTDAADLAAGLRYGFFIFDTGTETYVADLNTLAAGTANPDIIDITDARIISDGNDWSVIALVQQQGESTGELMRIGPTGIVDSNIIQSVSGGFAQIRVEAFEVSADGRFIAIQTSDWQLASNELPDTNDSSDVYLLDTLQGSVTRVSVAGGAEITEPTYLHDLWVDSTSVQVLITTDAALVSPTRLDTNSANLNGPLGSRTDLYLWQDGFDGTQLSNSPQITLQSIDRTGVASGYVNTDFGAEITSSGIFFSSDSETIAQADANNATDVFVNQNGNVQRVLGPTGEELSAGALFLSATNDGTRFAIMSSSPEYGGLQDVTQVVIVDNTANEQSVASTPGVVADNVAVSGLLSSSGYNIAITSFASNLTPEELAASGTGLFINQLAQPIAGQVYHWSQHALMDGVTIALADVLASGDIQVSASVATSANGGYEILASPTADRVLTASSPINGNEADRAINSADALAALKIAVGLNPNSDPDGAGPLQPLDTSPYQFIAADVNQDGRISSADALDILKMAVGLSTASDPQWLFLPQAETFWSEELQSYTLSRSNVNWSPDLRFDNNNPADANFVAVLQGDVNGSWQAPAGATVLSEEYFRELEQAGYGLAGKWGVLPIP